MKTENILNDSRLRALENHTRVNLLRPTLGTTTINGVTCTNNGDGTYTISGTNNLSSDILFTLNGQIKLESKQYKLLGSSYLASSATFFIYMPNIYDFDGYGTIFTADNSISYYLNILVRANATVNALIKPMITTDLTATYDDFVSYEDSFAINRNAAQKQDVLTLEEIQASTDLSGKIASASAVKNMSNDLGFIKNYGHERLNDAGNIVIDLHKALKSSYRSNALIVARDNSKNCAIFVVCVPYEYANVWTSLEVLKSSNSISASFDPSTGFVTLTFSQGAGFYSIISF